MYITYFNIWPNIQYYFQYYYFQFIFTAIIGFLLLIIIFLNIYFLFKNIYLFYKYKSIFEKFITDLHGFYFDKLQYLQGDEFIKQLINYLEIYKIRDQYTNITDILKLINLSTTDINIIQKSLYQNKIININHEINNDINNEIITKIKKNINNIVIKQKKYYLNLKYE